MKNHINNLLNKLKEKHIYIKLNNEDNIEVVADQGKIPAEVINEIKIHKEDIILFLKSLKKETRSKIEKVELSDSYVVSSAQRRLWIVCQNEEASISFNMPSSKILEGVKDKIYLFKAIDAVVERHEILRTVFKEDQEGALKQVVLDTNSLNFKIDYKDFRNDNDSQSKITDYLKEDSFKPFDLVNGPLLRVALLQISDEEFFFYYNMHHIISDEWSMGILEKEVLAYYESYLTDTLTGLPELEIQYKDYSVWENALLSSNEMEEHKEFWKKNLSEELTALNLPSTKKRPKFKTYNGNHFQTNIPSKSVKQLKGIIQNEEGSLFMGLLAVLKILLYKYTNERNIIIGFPMANRQDYELENQIGFYIKTLVLRNQLNPEDNFVAFFQELKKNTLSAFKHQDYPFDALVSELKLNHDPGRTPVYDISFTFHDSHLKEYGNSREVEYNVIKSLGKGKCKHDIEFHFEEVDDYVSFSMNFNTDVYEPEMIKRFMWHYSSILSEISSQPETSIKDISFLSEEENQQLIYGFNSSKVDYPAEKTVVDLFTEQAEKTPDVIAVSFEDKSLTYKELDVLSNTLAQTLQNTYDIKKNDFVGVHLTRSELSIISILGILKAGGVYVPIDAELPSNRKLYIAEDADLKLLITETTFIFDLDFYDGNIFSIDVELDFNTETTTYQNLELLPNDLAYVIYTSGSTGNPKGVMIKHGGIMNSIVSQVNLFSVHGCSKWVQFSSHSFDASVYEIFISLLGGYSLHILNEETRKDLKLFYKYIAKNSIDIAILPPAFLKMLDVEYLKGLKVLITAGESAIYDKASEFLKFGTYYNAYGPTEVSIIGTIYKIEKGTELVSEIIPIGKPIDNAEIYILDEFNNLLPEGVAGEIHIAGSGLAKGYLNRAELTAEKFVPNPYNEGELMYKTGDLGRWLPDGNIEYVGRIDEQVKIRGYRIELEEIEKHLSQQDEIKQGVVVVKETDGDKFLVAYYVSDVEVDKKQLQAGLSKVLPEYMIPSYYVKLEAIPVTTNCKIDRKLLPDVDENDLIKEEYIAPRSAQEKVLATLWSEVLKYEKIGVKDSFFNLGGDSIKSILLISRLKQQGYLLKVDQILRQPILEDLALLMEARKVVNKSEIKSEIKSGTDAGVVCSDNLPYIKTDSIWSYGDLIELSPNQKRFYKYKYSHVMMRDRMSNFNKSTFEKDFRNFLLGFPALSLKYETIENKVFQKYVHPNNVALQILIEDVSSLNDQQILKITNDFVERPYDLLNGDLIRCLVLQEDSSGSNAIITLTIHHSLLDQYSVNTIYVELCNYFQGKGKQSNYYHPFDFITKKEEFLLSEQGLKERDYWTDTLQETPLYNNQINPGKETVNVIQETVISDDRFINIKKMAKENNLPVSAFFIGFYEMILNTVNLDKRTLYSFMVNGREQEVEGMNVNNILGVTDNALPISYTKGDLNLDLESILEIYITYLKNRTYQGVPYETIRMDMLEATEYDIDENMCGYLNLFIKGGSVSSRNAVNEKLNIYHDNLHFFYGINLVCEIYKDGVYFKLMCPKDIFEKSNELISLDVFIDDLLKGIEINQNSEINTF